MEQTWILVLYLKLHTLSSSASRAFIMSGWMFFFLEGWGGKKKEGEGLKLLYQYGVTMLCCCWIGC
jgi:hypothetical protein